MKKWKCEKSELILDTKYFKVRQDNVVLPNGDRKEWIYWDSRDSAMVLGSTLANKLIMIRQYRYLVGNEVIEFPSGGSNENEPLEKAAKREFEEETGYSCIKLIKLGAFYETYGQLNRRIHIFYAPQVRELPSKPQQGEGETEQTEVELVDFSKAVKIAKDNKIVSMGSALAILLLSEYLSTRK